jgi:CheY-like chemotaxis protein
MLNILVLEDHPSAQDAWRWMLPQYGTFHVVACPAAAREVLAQGFRPDIIFSDWEMPGETGGSFCEWLRAQGDQTPVVIVSGAVRESAVAMGATACMLKPMRRDALEDALATWVQRRSARPLDTLSAIVS